VGEHLLQLHCVRLSSDNSLAGIVRGNCDSRRSGQGHAGRAQEKEIGK
jgi:hypothetical protein